jgi:hypothetical protein
MPSYQVTCISRDGPDPDYRIDELGFANNVYPIDDVIAWLQQSTENQLWVVDNAGNSVWVEIRQHPTSFRLYLATVPDGILLNNLASLPECP